jgi:hypothetical protein
MKNQNIIIGVGLVEKKIVMGNAIPIQFQNNPAGISVVIVDAFHVDRRVNRND